MPRPIDHTPTNVIPRQPSGTGPLPAVPAGSANEKPRDYVRPCPGWRWIAFAALVLAWVTLALWAYVLARAAWLLWQWR